MALADTVRRLIDKHGRHDGALVRQSQASQVDPARPWAPSAAVPAVSPTVASGLSVVVLDARTALRPEQLRPDQDSVAYLDADVEPKLLDVLETRGERYSVLDLELVAPGPQGLLYILHLKAS